MKIHLIKEKTIRNFVLQNSESRISFEDWIWKIKMANWTTPNDIINTFSNADILGNGSLRVVFDIAGNKYRIICKYAFGDSQIHLFVCWIGTHSQYDKLCKNNKQYNINKF